ncbi:MAG: glutamine--tRNA ligase/YqeY domain fusion protein [Meiothermus sp.]|nr:glutamine--tRNA ligase/YqeY domain fusion protein [Meiothermus sp.]
MSHEKPKYVAPNFITEIIERDLEAGRYPKVVTRFPPEPNGYAHLGHTFASYLNFGLSQDYGGEFRLRMDDTNPEAEKLEFANALIEDMRWLGWRWTNPNPQAQEDTSYASDYFLQLYAYAVRLIEKGLAYVDSVPPEEMARLRGTVDRPGTPSPYRERSVPENLELFERMKSGEFKNGEHVLRAKIDLSSPNMKLRDPVLYRIVHAEHYRTGSQWCVYPSYDFAQATTDALDGVTHSLCSLEFVDNRAIYDWLMEHLWEGPRPHQYEFGRRSLEYTVVSKRKLRRLVAEGKVSGWDDPRMPTLAGQRRRGVTPEAIRRFASQIGVSRTNRTVDIALLEGAIRDDLNHRAPRVMAVLRPLKVVLVNLEAERELELPYWPPDVVKDSPDGLVALPGGERVRPEQATRKVPLSKELFIEQEDFALEPPPGFKRLTPGGTVRLRSAGIIRCDSFSTDDAGQVVELRCTLLGEEAKAKGVIHWVSAAHNRPAEFRLYDRLFTVPNPELEAKEVEDEEEGEEHDFMDFVNPKSLEIVHGFVEASVAQDPHGTRYQFERSGYFWQDADSSPGALVFNRIIGLKDSWGEGERREGRGKREEGSKAAGRREQGTEKAPGHRPQPTSLDAEEQARFQQLRAKGVGEAEAAVLARESRLGDYLEQTVGAGLSASEAAGWVVNDLGTALREESNRVSAVELVELLRLVQSGEISRGIAKEVLAEAQQTGQQPGEIVRSKGLRQVSDAGQLEALLDGVMAANPDKVEAYRLGRTGLLGFFVGQVMRETKGQANPQVLEALAREKLGGQKL